MRYEDWWFTMSLEEKSPVGCTTLTHLLAMLVYERNSFSAGKSIRKLSWIVQVILEVCVYTCLVCCMRHGQSKNICAII